MLSRTLLVLVRHPFARFWDLHAFHEGGIYYSIHHAISPDC